MKRIFLIDCPGIVPPENASAADILLRGAVRTEKGTICSTPHFSIY